jgi:hypothetical protein
MVRLQSDAPGTAYWPDGPPCNLGAAYDTGRLNARRTQHSLAVQPVDGESRDLHIGA